MTDLRLEQPPTTLPPGSTVWAYLRDSGGPTQDRSVEQQREIIHEYCLKYKLTLIHPPFEDIHKSGGTTQGRNDFDYMMSLSATSERPHGLLIWNFARFSRGGPYAAQLYTATLRDRGIVIHSLTDKIPEGDFGPIIETFIHIANKQKKDEAAMGAWRGLRHIVKQGAVPGVPPLGFKRIPLTITSAEGIERKAHRWQPDPAYKHRINKAFKLKAAHQSLAQIHAATQLYSSINSYVGMFTNPIYIGILHYGELIVENYCAPTVPRKLWDAVQEITSAAAEHKHMHSNTKHPRRIKSVYLLSGILRCARCGGMLNGMSSPQPHGQPYRRYNCATAKIKKTCAIKPIPAKLAEQIVLDSVHKFLQNPQSIIDLFTVMQKHNQTASAQVDEERASLSAQLAPVRKKITNLTNAIAEKPHTRALLQKLESLETEEQQILQKLSDIKTRNTTPVIIPTPQQAANAAHHIQTQLKSKDPETIRQTLLGLIHQITIDRIGKQIIGKITFHTKK